MTFFVSEIMTTPPVQFENETQQQIYKTLQMLQIPFERVDTDDGSTMDDCRFIARGLHCPIVKTIFLCNRQQTQFYLYVTSDNRPFETKAFCSALHVPRVSFAPAELLLQKLGTRIGATTVLSLINDPEHTINLVIDQDVSLREYLACTDGTRNCFIKIKMEDLFQHFLTHTKHPSIII